MKIQAASSIIALLSAVTTRTAEAAFQFGFNGITFPPTFNVDITQTNTVQVATNLGATHDKAFFRYTTDICGSPGLDGGHYTLEGLSVANVATSPHGEELDGSKQAVVTITNSENLINTHVICFELRLYFLDFEDGPTLLATQQFSFDPNTVDTENLSVNGAVSNLDEAGLGSQTLVANSPGSTRDGSSTASTITTNVYGDDATWTITGDANYWYQITRVQAEELGVPGRDLTETDFTACTGATRTQGSFSCATKIPLTFFNEFETLTAVISYSWYATATRRNLEGGEGNATLIVEDGVDFPAQGTGQTTVIVRLVAPNNISTTKTAIAVALVGLCLAAFATYFLFKKNKHDVDADVDADMKQSTRTVPMGEDKTAEC